MKTAVLVMMVLAVTLAAPSDERPGPLNERPDPMLAQLLTGVRSEAAVVRTPRQSQSQDPMSPLGQLLQDALNIPQVALQAVSRLLTNPRNTIGQSTSAAHRAFSR